MRRKLEQSEINEIVEMIEKSNHVFIIGVDDDNHKTHESHVGILGMVKTPDEPEEMMKAMQQRAESLGSALVESVINGLESPSLNSTVFATIAMKFLLNQDRIMNALDVGMEVMNENK